MAIGIDGDHVYEEYTREDLAVGQIILLSTDGIWEARNPRGEMFGKDQVHHIIRQNHAASANEILSTCLITLNRFLGDRTPEDDVTMIVIKMIDD